MVGVSLLRNQSGSGSGDTPLPLFFSGLVGASANLAVDAVAALMPSNTIQIPPGGTSSLMPLAVPVDQWNALSTGNDNFHYDPATNTVSNGQDGIKEIDIYPIDTGTGSSRGLLDLAPVKALRPAAIKFATASPPRTWPTPASPMALRQPRCRRSTFRARKGSRRASKTI